MYDDNNCQCETWHLSVYHHRHLVTTAHPTTHIHTLPLPFRPGVLTRSIIRNHCSAPPLIHPPTPVANGTNLYSLSVLMSPHAEKWPYHRPSGSHHLSPSPVGFQAQCADGQTETEWGWVMEVHICLHFHVNCGNSIQMCTGTESVKRTPARGNE